MICTIYSHNLGFDRVKEIIKTDFPEADMTVSKQDESSVIEVEIKSGLFGSAKKIRISYRERRQPSYQIPEVDDSPLTSNLKGLYNYVSSLPTENEKIKELFLRKILTLNCEFSVQQEQGEIAGLKSFIQHLATEFDAVLFVQPDTIISKSAGQHFLDRNLNLIIDAQGKCEINDLEVHIDPVYFSNEEYQLTEDQKERKSKSEKIIEKKKIKILQGLPCVESEKDTTIREAKEIAQRVCVLAVTNYVAFNNISGEDAIDYLKENNLWSYVTEKEKDFLADPTDEKKRNETWKCECIWTLLWAINKVEELPFPDDMCNLKNVAPENYPIGGKDPNDYINSVVSARPKNEMLDANDLYYRLDWACVDARINGRQMNEVNPGVVYERHYALNWLVNYMEQDWDNITCDT